MERFDVAVVGAGIVGLATGLRLLARRPGLRVAVIEKEGGPARHQTGHNSGVIHAGLYYAPGSHKALLSRRGRAALVEFCDREGVPYEICGKLVVAQEAGELPALARLRERGAANGIPGITQVDAAAIAEYEPAIRGAGALHVPDTGIVDFGRVAAAMAARLAALGAHVRYGSRLVSVAERDGGLVLETEGGALHADRLVNCAGLHADRVARLCGVRSAMRIVPFRGEYYRFLPEQRGRVRNLVYPVPDARFPFLGVHFTRMMSGEVECGPNAVFTAAREGYEKGAFDAADFAAAVGFPGFWRLAARHWRYGLGELRRSRSKRAFAAALRALMPTLEDEWIEPYGAGVRAQALDSKGRLAEDFVFERQGRTLHVLNAPSPAATASLAIGEVIADLALT